MEPFLCTYCNRWRPTEQRSVEHPLGQAIGGSGWSTRDVCGDCNREAGKEVDQPFTVQPMIRALRHIHEVPDPRDGRVPPAPRLYGDLDRGGRAYIEFGRDGLSTHRLPHLQRQDETGVRYIVESGKADELTRKLKSRLRRKHGAGVQIESTTETVLDETTANIAFPTLMTTTWPRFGAKLGLAFGRRALGEDWLHTSHAAHLRDVLWGHETEPKDLDPLWENIETDDVFARLVPSPGHMVAVQTTDYGSVLIAQLFGKMRYGFPLSANPKTGDTWIIWVFDPVQGKAREMTFNELIAESMRRGDWHAAIQTG